jgi:hypothetical protein
MYLLKMEQKKLEEFNQWWINGKVDPELTFSFKRDVFFEVEKSFDKRFIIALVGLRRVGKTTIIYQLIKKLIQEGTNPKNILFFSFDENSNKLSEVLDSYKEFQAKDFREQKIYIFLDEIQKHENWENELKKYYDLYPKLKFIISGSESLFIRKRTKENLAGRIFEYTLTPFTFKEYLKLKGVKEEEFKYETKIKPLFIKFAEKGGFPETISLENEKEYKDYIESLVVDKIVYKDIPKLFKIDDPEFLKVLLKLIATTPGMYLDYVSLSRNYEKDRRVIKDYISYLKDSFLISLLGNYRKSSMASLRKKKRVYPADNSLSYIYKKVDETFFGKMVEALIINQVKATSFWKNGDEIDIVYDDMPIEVKYQEKINSEDIKPLIDFMQKFKKNKAMLITKNDEKEVKVKEGVITFVPAWKFALKGFPEDKTKDINRS